MDISIIIVNYNTASHLEECLNSIYQNTNNVSFEIIVVDNFSSENEIRTFPSRYPETKFIFLNENKGFGTGCNTGAKVARGKYFLFVNPDIIFLNNILTDLFRFMETNENVTVCSGVLTNLNGEEIYTYNYFPGVKWEFTEAIGRGSHKKILSLMQLPSIINKSSEPLDVDWLIGAFLFFRTDTFKKLKGFDERFFLYYEDVDIQKRAKNIGYKINLLPDKRICHVERSSVKSFEGENLYYFHMTRSKLIYYYTHANILKRSVIRLMLIIGLFFRIVNLPLRRKFKGKKLQKFYQYQMIMKLYISNYKHILNSKFSRFKKMKKFNYESSLEYDDFWK